jgi:hypothetical protein
MENYFRDSCMEEKLGDTAISCRAGRPCFNSRQRENLVRYISYTEDEFRNWIVSVSGLFFLGLKRSESESECLLQSSAHIGLVDLSLCPYGSYSLRRDSSVGIGTRYGLKGSEFEPRWGRDFFYPFWTTLRTTLPAGSFLGVKRLGLDLTTHPI